MSTASILISFGLLSLGGIFGWIARGLVVREQAENSEFDHGWGPRK